MHRHPPKRTHMQERFPNQQRGTAPEGGRRGPNGPEEREGQEERERDERTTAEGTVLNQRLRADAIAIRRLRAMTPRRAARGAPRQFTGSAWALQGP